jgi:hypothetical protein
MTGSRIAVDHTAVEQLQCTAFMKLYEYLPNNLQSVYSILAAGIRDIILWDLLCHMPSSSGMLSERLKPD